MPENFFIVELDGITLEHTSLRRDHVRKPERRSDHYLEKYDTETLFYDCFYSDSDECFVITAPRLLNLWPQFKDHLFVNGSKFNGRIKRQTWQRCEQLKVFAKENSVLEIQSSELQASLVARNSVRASFEDLNCLFALNKNNELKWIKDWVKFHINAHGLQAVCIVDNNSTSYTADELLNELNSIGELKAAMVMPPNYPYGPSDASRKLEISPRYLQTAMMNLLKQDAFKSARAILSVDVDELVVPKKDINVFDAAVKSKLGAVSFREIKTYVSSENEIAYPHNNHCYVKEDSDSGNTKWCVSGRGFMNSFGWAVHRFGGAFFPFTETDAFHYYHCQSTSTSWKNNKNRYIKQRNLKKDSRIVDVYNRYLPD